MKRSVFSSMIYILLTAVVLIRCGKDPVEPMEQIDDTLQQVTTWRMLMFSQQIQPTQLSYRDLDADGPDEPIITGGRAAANTTFRGQLEMFDETMFPELEINEYIKNNSSSFQIFFVGNGIDLNVTYTDEDINGNPIGLDTEIVTGDPGEGSITIILRQSPLKNNSNNPVAAGGETIGEVTIPLVLE